MEKQDNIHPEIAEGYIATVIRNYGNAGFLAGLPIDWDGFRASHFYETCVKKYGQEAVEKSITEQQKTLTASNIKPEAIQPNIQLAIREYVNAGLAVGIAPDWDKFRASKIYGSLTERFPQEQVDQAVADAKKQTDPLNKKLGDLGLE